MLRLPIHSTEKKVLCLKRNKLEPKKRSVRTTDLQDDNRSGIKVGDCKERIDLCLNCRRGVCHGECPELYSIKNTHSEEREWLKKNSTH